jgi:hypothetical protein
MSEVIKNALIGSVTLDDGGRGLLTGWLMLEYGDSGHQGFGGHTLYLPTSYKHHGGKNYAGHWIFRVMEIAGVSSWDKMKGKTIRVKLKSDMLNASIIAIGHIIKDDWFNPEDEFEKLKL